MERTEGFIILSNLLKIGINAHVQLQGVSGRVRLGFGARPVLLEGIMGNLVGIPSNLYNDLCKRFSLTCNYVIKKSGTEMLVVTIFAIVKFWSCNL